MSIRAASLALVWLAACGPALPEPPPATAALGAATTIQVTANGWHTGIVVPVAALTPGVLPERADFPAARHLELGWGDAAYYPMPDPPPGAVLRAAFAGGPAVLHVTGHVYRPEPGQGRTVVEIDLTAAGLAALLRALDASFQRPASPRPGLDPASRFYPATGRFSLFNTCNSWTARQLATAGVAVDPSGVITAGQLLSQLDDLPQPLVMPAS
ncbi:MAG: DUF2459 domain-containing protein [Geminicoccaceae bacterium]|nr:DUF2459 domain-containing protein [Geminicoccaceae bacterium]MCB9968108.1 DUF2459 domain-containing protein [Geminicoccaceae bacterium]HRY25146.1 DUF2459 domain-containing protein [Geminicoccaceae bacterium]